MQLTPDSIFKVNVKTTLILLVTLAIIGITNEFIEIYVYTMYEKSEQSAKDAAIAIGTPAFQ